MGVGKQIKKYRESMGWRHEDVALRSGVDIGTLSALEVRDSNRSKYFVDIARAFNLSFEQLVDTTREYPVSDPLAPPSILTNTTAPPLVDRHYDPHITHVIGVMEAMADERQRELAARIVDTIAQGTPTPVEPYTPSSNESQTAIDSGRARAEAKRARKTPGTKKLGPNVA